jgi:hypothetical protein
MCNTVQGFIQSTGVISIVNGVENPALSGQRRRYSLLTPA